MIYSGGAWQNHLSFFKSLDVPIRLSNRKSSCQKWGLPYQQDGGVSSTQITKTSNGRMCPKQPSEWCVMVSRLGMLRAVMWIHLGMRKNLSHCPWSRCCNLIA